MAFLLNRPSESSLSAIHTDRCQTFPTPQTRRPVPAFEDLEEAIQAAREGGLPWCVRLCPICAPGGREGCACR